eukprot:2414381-Prymnesium_polylepis.1
MRRCHTHARAEFGRSTHSAEFGNRALRGPPEGHAVWCERQTDPWCTDLATRDAPTFCNHMRRAAREPCTALRAAPSASAQASYAATAPGTRKSGNDADGHGVSACFGGTCSL